MTRKNWIVLALSVFILGAVAWGQTSVSERSGSQGDTYATGLYSDATVAEKPIALMEDESGELVGARICGTPEPTRTLQQRVESKMSSEARAWQGSLKATAGGLAPIPLVFHNIQMQSGDPPVGYVYWEQLDEQVRVLNKNFRKLGVEFYIDRVFDIENNSWFKNCALSKKNGKRNKKALKIMKKLAVNPGTTINIYLCKPKGNILGTATYPWAFPENSKKHGIALHYLTTPYVGFPYEEGDVAVHEMGHYFGLYHTFTPWGFPGFIDGCEKPGDLVRDTHYEAKPAYLCEPRNSCPQRGKDPIKNFMDYTDDACARKFTKGQRGRMTAVAVVYRPRLVGQE